MCSVCDISVTIPAVFAGHSPCAGATPNTNPQEGWHSGVRKVVVVSQRVPADRMIQEVFPNICENDCRWRHGEITMEPPETLPSKFVECAKKFKERGKRDTTFRRWRRTQRDMRMCCSMTTSANVLTKHGFESLKKRDKAECRMRLINTCTSVASD